MEPDMSGRKGQLRRAETLERVADVVRFQRECGFSWKAIARDFGVSPRQAQRYMSRLSGHMSHKDGSGLESFPRT